MPPKEERSPEGCRTWPKNAAISYILNTAALLCVSVEADDDSRDLNNQCSARF